MTIGRICSRTTHLADAGESVLVAAERMKDHGVGTLLVLGPDRRLTGIVTDRDLAMRVVGAGLDPRTTTVAQVMTAYPRTVQEATPIEVAVETMRALAVRRLPVVDEDDRLVGIVSVDDVLQLVTEELQNLGRIVSWSRLGAGLPTTTAAPEQRPSLATLPRK